MLKETKEMRYADLIIYDEGVYTPEELSEALGLRFLVEEDDDEDEDEDDGILILDDEEEEDLPFPVEEPKKSARDSRALITEAVEHGCTTASEIVKYTGLASQTVYNHRDLWKD